MYDNDENDEDSTEKIEPICNRCGQHADNLKCGDHYAEDLLLPMQISLEKLLDDKYLLKCSLGHIVEAADCLGRAMQAARDHVENQRDQQHR